mgnify:CR=1 FL=1
MLNWQTIDKITDFLNDCDVSYYMNWEEWKIEVDIKTDITKL